MPLLENIATQAAGMGMGMIAGAVNDQRQGIQQEKLNRQTEASQKRMGQFNLEQQMKLWRETSYGAQKREMEKAGINPALMYGMGGGGGQTAAIATGGAQGSQAAAGGGEIVANQGMAMQLQLLQAQKENIQADTELKKADATKTGGVDTELAKTAIGKMIAETNNEEEKTKLTKVQTKIAEIDEDVKGRSADAMVEIQTYTSEKILQEIEQILQQNTVGKAVIPERIQMVKVELAGKILENYKTRAQTENTKQDTKLKTAQTMTEGLKPEVMQTDMMATVRAGAQKWREIEIAAGHLSVEEAKQRQNEIINDVSRSTEIPIEIVEKVLQAVVFKNVLQGSPQKIQGFRR